MDFGREGKGGKKRKRAGPAAASAGGGCGAGAGAKLGKPTVAPPLSVQTSGWSAPPAEDDQTFEILVYNVSHVDFVMGMQNGDASGFFVSFFSFLLPSSFFLSLSPSCIALLTPLHSTPLRSAPRDLQ